MRAKYGSDSEYFDLDVRRAARVCRERGCGDRGCPTDALELLFDLASARWRSPPAGEGSWAL